MTNLFCKRVRPGVASSTEDCPDLWRCPKCGGPMKVNRKTHRCRNPTSFSTTDQLCGMRLPSSIGVFAILFHHSQFHVSCPAAQSRHRLTPLLPTIEFA